MGAVAAVAAAACFLARTYVYSYTRIPPGLSTAQQCGALGWAPRTQPVRVFDVSDGLGLQGRAGTC